MRRFSARRASAVVAAIGVVVIATASGIGTAGATTKSAAAPIKLGFINVEGVPGLSYPEFREAAKAALSYIDHSLGGVGGRQLTLVPCVTNGTAAGSATCASTLVSDKVLAASIGFDFGTTGSVPVLASAKIPLIGGEPLGPPEATSPDAFFVTGGGPGEDAARPYFVARVLRARSVSILAEDIPSQHTDVTEFTAVLKKLGVTAVNAIYAPSTITDVTSPLVEAEATKPDVIVNLLGPEQCVPFFTAAQELGITARELVSQSCATSAVFSAIPAGSANGAYFISEYPLVTGNDPNVVLFRKEMAKLAPSAPIDTDALNGFQSEMDIYGLLKKMAAAKTPLTSANLIKTIKATHNQANFGGHPDTCNGKRLPGNPALCNPWNRVLEDVNGRLTYAPGTTWISGAPYDLPPSS